MKKDIGRKDIKEEIVRDKIKSFIEEEKKFKNNSFVGLDFRKKYFKDYSKKKLEGFNFNIINKFDFKKLKKKFVEHYYSVNPKSKKVFYNYSACIDDVCVNITSVSGVFGKKLDKGTELLVKSGFFLVEDYSYKFNIPFSKVNILDLGCGTGVLGIFFKKKFDMNVFFSDVNFRAVEITKKNLKDNNFDGVVFQSDGFNNFFKNNISKDFFDFIFLNPPQSAGKKVVEKLIFNSKVFLKKKGFFVLVARHNKGGKSISSFMNEVFSNVSTFSKKSGFRVYFSIKE